MCHFGETLFGGGGFIRWALSPWVIVFAVSMPVLVGLAGEWTLGKILVIVGLEFMCLALLAGFWLPARVGHWANRSLAGCVFLLYLFYLVDQLRKAELLGQAFTGFVLIGLPCFYYAVRGRFGTREPLKAADGSVADESCLWAIELFHEDASSGSKRYAFPPTALYPVTCSCGSDIFQLARAGSETERTCAQCGDVRYISRFGDRDGWLEAVEDGRGPERFRCAECASDEARICLAFAGYLETPDLDAVKWFYVAVQCCECDRCACFNDGKVGRGPMGEPLFREIAGE